MNTFGNFQTMESSSTKATFLSTVWMYFGLAIGVAALGAWAGGMIIAATSFWVPYIAFMGLMLTQGMWAENKTLALPLFFVFSFVSGSVLYPTLSFAALTGQMGAVVQALMASAGLFFAAAIFGYTTKKDLSGWGQFLFFTMMGLFIAGILNIFMGSGPLQMIISGIAVVLFSAYTAYDLQAIKNGAYRSPIMAALHLYINMFALFNHLLTFFLSSGE